jgi:hypothetical protein
VQRSSTSGRESLVAFTSVPFPQLLVVVVVFIFRPVEPKEPGGSGKGPWKGAVFALLQLHLALFSLFLFGFNFKRKKRLPRDVCTQYAYRLAFDARGWYLP